RGDRGEREGSEAEKCDRASAVTECRRPDHRGCRSGERRVVPGRRGDSAAGEAIGVGGERVEHRARVVGGCAAGGRGRHAPTVSLYDELHNPELSHLDHPRRVYRCSPYAAFGAQSPDFLLISLKEYGAPLDEFVNFLFG